MHTLQAGFARVDVTPMLGIGLGGYFKVRKAEAVLDELELNALALGCDQIFAKRFGRDKQPPCPYIVGVPQEYMTAAEWNKILRRTARSMEARMRQMPVENRFFRS